MEATSYYKYIDEDDVPCFLELDEELYCLRAVYKPDENYINTNLVIYGKYFLPEGALADGLELMTAITRAEFLEYWQKSTSPHLGAWNKLKQGLKIGEKVKTEILCFYPQGTILEIGQQFYGIVNNIDFQRYYGMSLKNKQIGEKKVFKVVGFDDENLWVNLEL